MSAVAQSPHFSSTLYKAPKQAAVQRMQGPPFNLGVCPVRPNVKTRQLFALTSRNQLQRLHSGLSFTFSVLKKMGNLRY